MVCHIQFRGEPSHACVRQLWLKPIFDFCFSHFPVDSNGLNLYVCWSRKSHRNAKRFIDAEMTTSLFERRFCRGFEQWPKWTCCGNRRNLNPYNARYTEFIALKVIFNALHHRWRILFAFMSVVRMFVGRSHKWSNLSIFFMRNSSECIAKWSWRLKIV